MMPSRRSAAGTGAPDWTAYAQYHLGIALVRKGRLNDAKRYLDRVGRMATANEELLSLRIRRISRSGFALLQAQRAAEARPIPGASAPGRPLL